MFLLIIPSFSNFNNLHIFCAIQKIRIQHDIRMAIRKVMFGIQNLIFRFLPESCFNATAFGKRDMFVLGNSMKDLDFSGEVQKLRCPTLILCGEKDGANHKSAGYFSRNIAGVELKIIGHTGHIVNKENPAALAQTLDEFYRRHE